MENGGGWEASDWIALSAVIVTGVTVVVTALVAWWRMRYDARMQNERLAHERREALTTTAAEGYAAASKLQKVIHPDAPPPIAERRIAAMSDARQPLDVIVAVGWSAEVRAAAMVLVLATTTLAAKSFAMSGLLEQEAEPAAVGRAEAQLQAAWDQVTDALAKYQVVISGD